jgi:hypothetical protein
MTILLLFPHASLSLPSDLFFNVFRLKFWVHFLYHLYVLHPLDLFTLIMFEEEYRLSGCLIMKYSPASLFLLSSFQVTNRYTYILVNIEPALGFLSPCGFGQCSDHKLTGGRPARLLTWYHSIPKISVLHCRPDRLWVLPSLLSNDYLGMFLCG